MFQQENYIQTTLNILIIIYVGFFKVLYRYCEVILFALFVSSRKNTVHWQQDFITE